MITPNNIYIDGEEITNKELFLEYKKTYLILQRALLKANLIEQVEEVGRNYEKLKKTFCKETESGKN